MKTESEIKEQIEVYQDLLMRSEHIEEVRKNQGILFALKWVTEKNEEKKDAFNDSTETTEGDTGEPDE